MAKTIKQLVFNGQAYQFHAANVNNYDDTDVKNRLTTLETNEANLLPKITFDEFMRDNYSPLTDFVSDIDSRIHTIETGYQNEAQVNAKIQAVVGAAPEALDTLEEIAAKLNDNENVVSALVSTIAAKADSATVTGIGNRVTELEKIDHTKYLTEHQDLSDYAKNEELLYLGVISEDAITTNQNTLPLTLLPHASTSISKSAHGLPIYFNINNEKYLECYATKFDGNTVTYKGQDDNYVYTILIIFNETFETANYRMTSSPIEKVDMTEYSKTTEVESKIADAVEDVCEAMTQEEYDALSTKKTGKLYLITD